jgi:hypothetical protein
MLCVIFETKLNHRNFVALNWRFEKMVDSPTLAVIYRIKMRLMFLNPKPTNLKQKYIKFEIFDGQNGNINNLKTQNVACMTMLIVLTHINSSKSGEPLKIQVKRLMKGYSFSSWFIVIDKLIYLTMVIRKQQMYINSRCCAGLFFIHRDESRPTRRRIGRGSAV